jgi:hypothetical protein
MEFLGLLISVILVGYVVYKLWKKIIILIIVIVVGVFIYSVSKVNGFISFISDGKINTDSIKKVEYYEDDSKQDLEYVHPAIDTTSTEIEFDYRKNNTKK